MKTFFDSSFFKRLLILTVLLCICTMFVFSAGDDTSFGVAEKVEVLLKFITSPWVKAIACIALIVECIALITAGRQEPGMFKKFLPWIIGTIIFMAAGSITNAFLGNKSGLDAIESDLDYK